MKLKEILIDSYRSVCNQRILLDFTCKGFIGLNESGKSNVLNAIRALEDDHSFTLKDRSKINGKLPKVIYKFSLGNGEIESLVEYMNKNLKTIPQPEGNIFKEFTISEVEVIVSIDNSGPEFKKVINYSYNISYKLVKDYLYLTLSDDGLQEGEITIDSQNFSLPEVSLVEKQYIGEELMPKFVKIESDDFKEALEYEIEGFLQDKLPTIIFWEYNSKYLLPSEMTYEEFMKDNEPFENSAPLFNMFLLSGRLNISDTGDLLKRIVEWKADSSLRRKEAAILTEDVNRYIKGIWSDYDQDLAIELEENKITIHINDPDSSQKNYYEMEARSQGFKTFISFILTIGAEYENGTLSDFILLLDEPETHLHPSGVRFMRDELFKLSDGENYVFYATHSIFMIDRKELRRHYIVSKDNECTKINVVERNNITQEAVIYEALGTTIDEFSLSNRNIMFEGDLDLLLFKYYIINCLPKKNNHLLDYCLLNGGGTKRMSEFFSRKLIPKDSEWNIILDNDSPGQKFKENLNDEVKEDNFNLRFFFYSAVQNHELEDILPVELIESTINQTLRTLSFPTDFVSIDGDARPYSIRTEEFVGRNKISKNEFEEYFKNSLYINCDLKLKEITKEKTIQGRNTKFMETFQGYYNFMQVILKEFKVQIKEEE